MQTATGGTIKMPINARSNADLQKVKNSMNAVGPNFLIMQKMVNMEKTKLRAHLELNV